MEIKSYKDLIVWQRGRFVVREVYELCKQLPKTEQYGLISQMQRASVSIPANIAEGYGKSYPKEYIHHLSHARGSLYELEIYLFLLEDLKYISVEELSPLTDEMIGLTRMLSKLITVLQDKLK
jgi:four helix bundle protein